MANKTTEIRIPYFLKKSTEDENVTEDEKVELVFNGVIVHSLKELRENYNAEEMLDYYIEGDLLAWLEQHYYENEASALKEISCDQQECIQKVYRVLGIDYASPENMSEAERNKWEAKKRIVSEYTSDDKILSELWLVAMNQEELAELLDKQEKKIYLCKDSFSVPIKISGMEYIGIGNAAIDNPYTKEQYEKAGIKISGFDLPKEEEPATAEIARKAAISNEYDDFHESHTPLATAYHKELKSRKLMNMHQITYNTSAATKFFNSKSECERAREHCIRKAYDEAEKYITAGNSKSLSKEAADFYSKQIILAFSPSRKKLEALCSMNGSADLFHALMKKVDKSYKALLAEFENELKDNVDYYAMYDFDYFVEQAEIEEHDYRIFDDVFTRTLETLFTDSIQYTITDIHSAISEIENDLGSRANTFYEAAFNEYKSYISEIEELLDKIGKKLPEITITEDFASAPAAG